MTRGQLVGVSLGALLWAVLPGAASAQQGSGIAGAVRDTSGGVLPGVNVETASPVLIEKVRSVVTDAEGRYSIVDLKPGTYSVTFTLPGFSVVKREGIVLTAGFTAAVNADLQVGSLEETITVSGSAPLVDTQNVRTQNVVSKDLLEVLPAAGKSMNMIMTLTPGLNMGANSVADVTGGRADFGSFHGKAGTKSAFDGMGIQNLTVNGATGYIVNGSAVEEMTMQTSGISAETGAEGAIANFIPKDGGNQFHGSFSGMYTNDHLQANNMTDELRSRGLPENNLNKVLRVYDYGLTLGGPIMKDKLWFFIAPRAWGNAKQGPGYFNKTPGAMFFTPDFDRPANGYQWYDSRPARITWQATPKNKISAFIDPERICQCGGANSGNDPIIGNAFHQRGGLHLVTWSSPVTSRLLVEAGAAISFNGWHEYLKFHGPEDISILEQSTNFRYNAKGSPRFMPENTQDRLTQRAAVSYVTGSHAFKFGFGNEGFIRRSDNFVGGGNLMYRFNNGIPNQIIQWATPYQEQERSNFDLGIYAQDQWVIKRFTLNMGLRFDYRSDYAPAQHVDATPWIPARDFNKVECVPCFKDLDPRMGVAYDLFGNGRTALKFAIGRYVNKAAIELSSANNPLNTSVNSANRTWTDSNGNYIPDCNLGNFAKNGECGAISNANFGKNNPTATQFAEDSVRGWFKRYYNWDTSTEIQHQLTSAVSVTAGYYKNWYGNFAFAGGGAGWTTVTDNLLVTPNDYKTFCAPAPVDPRLPGGGGYQVCGLYDLNPDKFGQVQNLVTQSSHYGKQRLTSDFITVNLNTRFNNGMRIGGGFDTGRTVNDQCYVIDSPQQMLNCKVVTPFKGQTQLKMNGSYQLPYDISISGVLLSLSGPAINTTYTATNAQVMGSLGRPLTGATTVTVPLVAPQTQFEKRITRLDLRLGKNIPINKKFRLQGNFDIYNIFNTAAITASTATYGPTYLVPTQVMDGRLLQFSVSMTY